MNHDELSQLDAAFVLSALDPDDRGVFEEHLRSCSSCSQAVRELAGLPRLLGHVDRSVFLSGADSTALPESLLPGLLEEVQRARRRRLMGRLGGVAAAAVLVVTGAVGWTQYDGLDANELKVQPQQEFVPMRQVGQDDVRASLAMEKVAWGTRLELRCTYAVGRENYTTASDASYRLVVLTGNGQWQEVATWRGVPGRTITVSAATAVTVQEISSVEIRTMAGRPLLRLDP